MESTAPAPPHEAPPTSSAPLAASQVPAEPKSKRPPRGKGRPQTREVLVSKALSKLLRHDAEKHKLQLDAEGFAALDKVLQVPIIKSLKCTIDEIHTIVADNAKQRFAMRPSPSASTPPNPADPSHYLIRANQGHSIAISSEALLTKLTPETIPSTVVHGTYFAVYPLILASGGLSRMGRNHIHFSVGLPEDTAADVISGMRNDSEVLVYIDVGKSMEDGVSWWMSDNGVVLTEGDGEGKVGSRYWKMVVGRKGGVGVLWEDGREVAQLPEGIKGKKVPVGKAAHPKARGGQAEGRTEGGKGEKRGHRGGKGKKVEEQNDPLAASVEPEQQKAIEEAVKELEATAINPPLVVETVTSPPPPSSQN